MLMRALTFVILSSSFFLNMTFSFRGLQFMMLHSIFATSYPLIKLGFSNKSDAEFAQQVFNISSEEE